MKEMGRIPMIVERKGMRLYVLLVFVGEPREGEKERSLL